jgi:tetratricopeptide (TPR) repeat protein
MFCTSTSKKIQTTQKNDPKYQYNMGLFYLNEGTPDRAVTYLNRSLQIKPGNFLVYHALGLAYSMKGELEKSVASFQSALQTNPKSTETRNALGIIYQEMGFLDKAEEEFKLAITDKSYTSRALPHYNLARLNQLRNRAEDAIFHLENAIMLDNRFVMALNLKGIILEDMNRLHEAIDAYKKALNALDLSKSTGIQIQYNLAVAHFKNGENISARQIFEKIYSQVTDPEMKKDILKYLKMIK